jgi:chromosomal replication initiation ATPase DnaA
MLKLALASDSKKTYETYRRWILATHPEVKEQITTNGKLFSSVFSITNTEIVPSEELLLTILARLYRINDVREKVQSQRHVKAREAAAYILHERFAKPYTEVAVFLGYRSHVSCSRPCKVYPTNLLNPNMTLKQTIKLVIKTQKCVRRKTKRRDS